MTVINSVNYREDETCFPKQEDLTRRPGCPTYESLHQLQLELKANTISVHSNLLGGGNQHGHLGLLMTDQQYALIVNNEVLRMFHGLWCRKVSDPTNCCSH